jgi:hypothetical protein
LNNINKTTKLFIAELRRIVRRKFYKYPGPFRGYTGMGPVNSCIIISIKYEQVSFIVYRRTFNSPGIIISNQMIANLDLGM